MEFHENTKGHGRSEATRLEVLEKAAEAFSEQGFHGASLRSIAKKAGVDHSTLIYHFGNKTSLLIAVLEWYETQLSNGNLDTIFDIDVSTMAAGFVAAAKCNQAAPGLTRLFSVMSAEAGHCSHPARPYMVTRCHLMTKLLTQLICAQRKNGTVQVDELSADEHAAMFLSTWSGMQVYDALNPGVLDIPEVVERLICKELGLDDIDRL